ncbi:threonine-phosphate decarboxylase CobD [Lachnoclostridium sp. An138]|uniref:threonine-phosphate decarboxylase CobD n=1 Tax=Lachnoclostridium sp. An138 TaxID=1965560 RepID=UPI000B376298|nr:threonine-phosphate decarboxylase CobD [Lachnoclostridium sp. An138]OUQ20276.1 threonine-phosphate decarboxylase [Lachnoclostridium sp. An138]
MAECKFLHGGDLQGAAEKSGKEPSELLDFSANINPLGMPPGVREAVVESLEQSLCYPDPFCRRLRRELAEHTGQKPEHILCGNGGADLIYRLVYALRPKKALVTAPAFAEYEEALVQTETEILFHELGENPVTEAFLERLSPDLDLVFLCNPNNPTGLLTEKPLIRKLLDRTRELGARLLLDECFLDFVPEEAAYTAADLLEKYPNLVILKSFTKLFAIPGLRLGYVLCSDTELLSQMQKAGQPWAVSEPAQAAGIAALRSEGFQEQTIRLVTEERAFLKKALEDLGFHVLDGQANYLCFRAQGDENLTERLLREGILLRSCANYRGLGKDYYRTAVRSRKENERLLAALGKVVGQT